MNKKPKYNVDEIRKITIKIAKQYDNIERIFLFGSYARGDAKAKSDIDFRIDVSRGTGYFKLSEIYGDFENSFKTKVDLLTTGALNSDFLTKIAKEEILLYGK
ncbi:MAG: nucleotidyltransferase domain-containing protein [Chitinivibrionia bacterium]|nr:nucleotidyltransferase domain-containing protein [Chitinivibrionia bacterium]